MHRINFPIPTYVDAGLLRRLEEIPQLKNGALKGSGLIVTDRGLTATDIPDRVQAAFRTADFATGLFSELETNPGDVSVEAGTAAYRAGGHDFIIGLGGGSALDVAKTIAVRLNHDGPLEQYDDLKGGDALFTKDIPPIVAIPTTAGTGSEVSRSSVIHIAAVDRKVVLFTPRMMPALAILDPELTVGLPPSITAFTGIDALTHLLEAYVALGFNPLTDGIAVEGVEMVFRHLPVVMEEPGNLESRQGMLMASLMGAVAFQKGLGAAHSMAHPLSSVCNLHHGQANAIVLTAVMAYNRSAIGEERFRKLSFAAAPDYEPSYEGFMAALTDLLETCSIPESLSAVGVTAEHVERMVPLAQADGCHQTNPRPMDTAGFQQLYTSLLVSS